MRTLPPAEVNKVPSSIDEWKNQARQHQITGSIHDLGSTKKTKSASKFDFKHFLGLRVIYKVDPNDATSSTLPSDIREQFPVPPGSGLETVPGWQEYLDQIRDFASDDPHIGDSIVPAALGHWAPVWQYQMHVLLGYGDHADLRKVSDVSPVSNQSNMDLIDQVFSAPFVDIKGRPINDDKTPNVFLSLFLSFITADTVPFHTQWLGNLKAMVYEKKVRYAARTDGYLRGKTGGAHALIDVNPRTRTQGDVAIRMQQSALMAAWLTQNRVEEHDPHKDCRIFLLSQDRDEIFFTFPNWGKAYGKDKDGSKGFGIEDDESVHINHLDKEDFLWMEEYGPFRWSSVEDVQHIAGFLRGYTLHVSLINGVVCQPWLMRNKLSQGKLATSRAIEVGNHPI